MTQAVRITHSLVVAVIVLASAAPPARSAPPLVMHTPGFESAVRADADDLIMIGGTGFHASDRVIYAAAGPVPNLHPKVVPQRSDALRGVAPIVQIGDPPYAITARMPRDILTGRSYRLWVVNAQNEWSDAVSINDPRPQWFSPTYVYATQDVANLGRRLRVIGRNLTTDAATLTAIRLRGPRTYELATVPSGSDSRASWRGTWPKPHSRRRCCRVSTQSVRDGLTGIGLISPSSG